MQCDSYFFDFLSIVFFSECVSALDSIDTFKTILKSKVLRKQWDTLVRFSTVYLLCVTDYTTFHKIVMYDDV